MGGGYSSPILCVPQLASPLFYQLPALRCKTRQNECHGIESPTFISFLRKLSKSEKIIPSVVLVKLSAEQRNKWRKSPPFTTIFPYQYNRDSCRECEERPKNHGSASKILCNFFSKRFFLSWWYRLRRPSFSGLPWFTMHLWPRRLIIHLNTAHSLQYYHCFQTFYYLPSWSIMMVSHEESSHVPSVLHSNY